MNCKVKFVENNIGIKSYNSNIVKCQINPIDTMVTYPDLIIEKF